MRGGTGSSRQADLRLFVAVYPPPTVASALIESLAGLDLPGHRLVPLEQVHLTLQFIGDTPAARLENVAATVRKATGGLGPFELTARRLITLPQRGRARLVAAEADAAPGLYELQRRLVVRLSRKPRSRPGDRFRPHFTLCRFRSPQAIDAVAAPVEPMPFTVSRVALMRSVLRPQGAQHDEVAGVELR